MQAKVVGCDGRVNYHGRMRRALVFPLALTCFALLGCAGSTSQARSNDAASAPNPASSDPGEAAHDPSASRSTPEAEATTGADADDTSVDTTTGRAAGATERSQSRDADTDQQPAPGAKRETRTKDVITKTVLEHRQQVRDCYEIARQDEPTLQGTLTVHFEIDPKGRVTAATLNEERSTLKDPSLVSCALSAFKTIRFPPSSRGYESEGNYPFDFRP